MKLRNFGLAVALSLATMSLSQAGDTGVSIGALGGLGLVNNNAVGTQFAVGAEAEYRVKPMWSAGLYGAYNSLGGVAVPGFTASTSLFTLAAEANYLFQDVRGLRVGALVGPAFTSATTNGVTNNITQITYGPSVGYDNETASGWGYGIHANYLFNESSTGGVGENILNIFASVKFAV